MPTKAWNEIISLFPNFKGYTVEVRECISDFITHFDMDEMTYLWASGNKNAARRSLQCIFFVQIDSKLVKTQNDRGMVWFLWKFGDILCFRDMICINLLTFIQKMKRVTPSMLGILDIVVNLKPEEWTHFASGFLIIYYSLFTDLILLLCQFVLLASYSPFNFIWFVLQPVCCAPYMYIYI